MARLVAAVGRADAAAVAATRDELLLEVAREWAEDAGVTGLRESTLYQYRLSLGLMARGGIRTVADATPLAVRAWMKRRLREGRSPETANRNLAALTSLLSWLHDEGRVPLAQVLELRELFLERPFVPPPEFLERDRYRVLREVARTIDPARRFEFLIAFGVEAGLRFHEARQLRTDDLELDVAEPFVRVSHTHGRRNKTDRERTVPIRVAFAQELRERAFTPGPLFPARARTGERLRSPYFHRGTFRAWRKASLERAGRWTWHLLRHTFGSWHVQRGRTITEVSTWLGCSEQVAKRHYARLAPGGNRIVEATFADVPTFSEVA